MTAATGPVDRPFAAGVVEDALVLVFDADIVRRLREDSPLSATGMTHEDAVCVVDAVATVARRSGRTCDLTDDDVAGVVTVADLVDAVAGGLAVDA